MSGGSKRAGLSERLRRNLEERRREIEELAGGELGRLGESLRGYASGELRDIERSVAARAAEARQRLAGELARIEVESGRAQRHLRRAWLRPLVTGVSLSAGISLGLWAQMRWLSGEIRELMQESARLELRIEDQRRTVELLEGETWGVSLHEREEGRYVVLPRGAELGTGWTIGGRPSVRFSER